MAGYLLDLVTLWALFAVAATVVATLAEEVGFIHAGAAAFMGFGAYTAALLSTRGGVSTWAALLGATIVGSLAGVVIHLLTSRLREDMLALATLAVGVVAYGFMLNAEGLTGGAMGIAGIPRHEPLAGYVTLDAVLLLIAVLSSIGYLSKTVFGKRVRAVRDDESLAADLLLRPARIRLALWVGSSSVLALVGGLYAFHLRFIDPSSFAARESVSILAMAMLIPAPKPVNASLGAIVFVSFPEVLRYTELPSATGAQLRQMLFGVALLLVVARTGVGWRRVPKARNVHA